MKKHRRRAHQRRTFGYILLTCLLIVSAFTIGRGHVYSASFGSSTLGSTSGSISGSAPGNTTLLPTFSKETVMVVGGSMAHGWKDPRDNSYIRRAFSALTASTNTEYTYVDRTMIGGTGATLAKSQYTSWLQQDQPQVVVISWGLLNDIDQRTTLDSFNRAIHEEIADALQSRAVVLLATPVVVKSTVADADLVNSYIQNEMADANAFHSPNVYFFDINAQMSAYLEAHNQTWEQYYGDSWHPNEAGHRLAGQLLFDDMIQALGQTPIEYKTNH